MTPAAGAAVMMPAPACEVEPALAVTTVADVMVVLWPIVDVVMAIEFFSTAASVSKKGRAYCSSE